MLNNLTTTTTTTTTNTTTNHNIAKSMGIAYPFPFCFRQIGKYFRLTKAEVRTEACLLFSPSSGFGSAPFGHLSRARQESEAKPRQHDYKMNMPRRKHSHFARRNSKSNHFIHDANTHILCHTPQRFKPIAFPSLIETGGCTGLNPSGTFFP